MVELDPGASCGNLLAVWCEIDCPHGDRAKEVLLLRKLTGVT